MIFKFNGIDIDTAKYISSFVDENTGEIVENRKVLDKQIRLLWFRSEYPKAVFKKSVEAISNADNLTEENNAVTNNKAALAKTEIYDGDKLIAQNYAMRYEDKEKKFTYYVEAALNASTDRAICDLGFICPEELSVPCPVPVGQFETENPVNESSKAISEIAELVSEDDTIPVNSEPYVPPQQNQPCYDTHTPVDDIIKVMSKGEARAYVIKCGKLAGKTVGEVFESDKDSNGFSRKLDFFVNKYSGSDNILRAACAIVNRNK